MILFGGNFVDMMDEMMKEFYNISQEELEYLFEILSDEELEGLGVFISNETTFGEKKKAKKLVRETLRKRQ